MKVEVKIKKRVNQFRPELGWLVQVVAKDGGMSTCVDSEHAACAKAAEWIEKRSWRS